MKLILLSISFILFVISFGVSQDLPSYIPTDGLIAYYPFNGKHHNIWLLIKVLLAQWSKITIHSYFGTYSWMHLKLNKG